jgi:predicted enzyme related to lactoylglutathione lyase
MLPYMKFASVRMPTADVPGLVGFYEQLTGTTAEWATDEFAEIVPDGAVIAISSERLTDAFAAASVTPAANRTMMVELMVDDVDALRDRVAELAGGLVMEPTTLPWGNRSMLLRDPDGNVVNLFTPVTPEAIARFAGR